MRDNQPVTRNEYLLNEGAAIISRTDRKGLISACNDEFVEASGFLREELIGKPHNLVRHPDMPQEAFRDLWTTLKLGRPWSGMVKNRRKNGDFYWVRATVTPLPDGSGYSSVRVKPGRDEVERAEALYTKMRSDPSIRLHEGRPGKVRRWQLPAVHVATRLWAMVVIPLLTIAVVAADGMYDRHQATRMLGQMQSGRMQPIQRFAEINDLSQATLIELMEAESEIGDEAALARRQAQVARNRASVEKAWQLYMTSKLSDEERELARLQAGRSETMWKLIDQTLKQIGNGQAVDARELIKGDLHKARLAQNEAMDRLKAYQNSAAEADFVESGQAFKRGAALALALILFGGGATFIFALINQRYILSSLMAARQATQIIARGKLTEALPPASEDELGALLCDVAMMRNTLHELIATIRQNAEALDRSSVDLVSAATRSAEVSGSQSNTASDMAAAVEELSVSIDMVDDRANLAAGATQEASDSSTEGGRVIGEASREMQRISSAINTAAESISDLEKLSGQISRIVSVIREVSDQTNLLALNAAIEAARAGEQGRGFAVVADEVRLLAERTNNATGEIATMIGEIQSGTQRAVQQMQHSVAQAANGVELAQLAGNSISTILDGSTRVLQAVSDISHALREQSVAAREITKQVDSVARNAETGSTAASLVADSARKLEELAARTRKLTEQFRIV
jgi:PAS domain S-box-containing protein